MSMETAALRHIVGQQIASEASEWERVSDELAERILARVPLSSLVRACAVAKHWKAIIREPGFGKICAEARPSKPWLFVFCTNYLLPSKNQAYAYDPDSNRWYIVPPLTAPPHSRASMAGGVGGIMVASMGGTQSRLCYNHSLFLKHWKETTEMAFSRDAPLVGIVQPEDGDVTPQKVIAVGGVEVGEDDELAVEIFDPAINRWEITSSLPEQFRGNSSRHWLSGAFWNQRLYVLEIYSGSVASFDLKTKKWSPVQILRPMIPSGVKYAYLVNCKGMLLLAGVCHPPDGRVSFKLWLVDDKAMECKEVGVMHSEYFALFSKGDGGKNVLNMKCVASGSLVYVYSVSPDADYPMVACDVSQGWNCWKKLPDVPSKGHRFDAMVGYCSTMDLDALLGDS